MNSKITSKNLKQRRKIQNFIDRFLYKASKASQAQSKIKMLKRLESPTSIIKNQQIKFEFINPELISSPIISIENGTAGYKDK
ncbi:MAG: hypothetical protein LBS66_04295 [Rhodospirillaceae bacterium]|nr:hypothetical protein [Rhodospirillaceae bacterium]